MKRMFQEMPKDALGRIALGSPVPCRYCGKTLRTYDEAYRETFEDIKALAHGMNLDEIREQAHDIAAAEVDQALKVGAAVLASNGKLIWYKPPTKCCDKASRPKLPTKTRQADTGETVKLLDIRRAWELLGGHFSYMKPLSPSLETAYLDKLKHLKTSQLKQAIGEIITSGDVRPEHAVAFILEHTKPAIDTRPIEMPYFD